MEGWGGGRRLSFHTQKFNPVIRGFWRINVLWGWVGGPRPFRGSWKKTIKKRALTGRRNSFFQFFSMSPNSFFRFLLEQFQLDFNLFSISTWTVSFRFQFFFDFYFFFDFFSISTLKSISICRWKIFCPKSIRNR